jgi:uncharacterized protein YerC
MPVAKKSNPISTAQYEYLKEDFIANINKNTGIRPYELTEDCWDWTGSTQKFGHGIVRNQVCNILGIFTSHRLSMYFFKNAEFVANETLNVLHACDRPQCVNPGHLRMGSDKENVHDAHGRGRAAVYSGSDNNFAKFNDDQIKEIIELRKQANTYPEIATRYGCSRRTIEDICLGKTGYSTEVVVVNARQRKFEEIRELLRQGVHTRVIAERLHTSSATIVKIRKEMP